MAFHYRKLGSVSEVAKGVKEALELSNPLDNRGEGLRSEGWHHGEMKWLMQSLAVRQIAVA
jgi:hypothetical protein